MGRKAEYSSDFDPETDVHGALVEETKKKRKRDPRITGFSYMGMGQTWVCTPNMS